MGGYRGYDKIAKTGFHNNFSKETWDEYSITIFFSCEVYNQTFSILVSPPMLATESFDIPLFFPEMNSRETEPVIDPVDSNDLSFMLGLFDEFDNSTFSNLSSFNPFDEVETSTNSCVLSPSTSLFPQLPLTCTLPTGSSTVPTTPLCNILPTPSPIITPSPIAPSHYPRVAPRILPTTFPQVVFSHMSFLDQNTKFLSMMIHTEGRTYELIEQQLDTTSKMTQLGESQSLYLRWVTCPPERVHATSPSRLLPNAREGAPFGFSLQLVAHCPATGKYVPFIADRDIPFTASIYGKRKPKTGAVKGNINMTTGRTEYVKLHLNPVGRALLMQDGADVVQAVVKKGDSMLNFSELSLTCGSNAARSKKAIPAARVWDWDYHLLIKPLNQDICIHSLMSKHLTTDSNRSQTRKKRKRNDSDVAILCELPATKKSKQQESSSPSEDTIIPL